MVAKCESIVLVTDRDLFETTASGCEVATAARHSPKLGVGYQSEAAGGRGISRLPA